MNEKSYIALELLRTDDRASWVRDQLASSFSEGIAQSAKDLSIEIPIQFSLGEGGMTQRERTKRDKYETSRPYKESEKIDLIRHALHEVYVTVPSVQLAAISSLLDLGARTATIEFSSPDEEDSLEPPRTHTITMQPSIADDLKQRFNDFNGRLAS